MDEKVFTECCYCHKEFSVDKSLFKNAPGAAAIVHDFVWKRDGLCVTISAFCEHGDLCPECAFDIAMKVFERVKENGYREEL